MSKLLCLFAGLIALCLMDKMPARAQSSGSAPQSSAPYTLRTSARAVVLDVLVQDKHGDPILGLPRSAFHIFDEGAPQAISSFEEHQRSADPPAETASPAAPGIYRNDIFQHLPAILNVAVLDIGNLSLADQMFLSAQWERFIRKLPAGIALAVYLDTGGTSLQVQNFTADHALLLSAVHCSIPRFPAMGREYFGDNSTLHQIAVDLAQYPGRKNVLWFSGGSTVSLNPIGMVTTPSQYLRETYDELESGRIAVLPIDARGLLVDAPPGLFTQHGLMQDIAEATGGLPFYNTNGIAQSAERVVQADQEFYTLTYAPSNFKSDDHWHKVRLHVDGEKLRLSYRRGYFADKTHDVVAQTMRAGALGHDVAPDPGMPTPQAAQTASSSGGPARSQPIIFRAEVKPLTAIEAQHDGTPPPRPSQTRYTVRLALPADAFTRSVVNSETQVAVNVGFLAMDSSGVPLFRLSRRYHVAVDEARLKLAPDTPLPIEQHFYLNRGDTYVYLLVWDADNRRFGTLTIPLHVPAS